MTLMPSFKSYRVVQIDPASYGPGCDVRGYYINAAGMTVYVAKRPGWGWMCPTFAIIDTPF